MKKRKPTSRASSAVCSVLLAICCPLLVSPVTASEFPGRKSQWNGYDRYDFETAGRKCLVVTPKKAAEGKPWIWRARFFGHQPQADLQLLERGFHLVYCDVANLFGSPSAVKHWNAFYSYLTKEHGFASKAALEGMSRGGLIIYNWAAANPDKVACIYGDAPVCDFKSWPGGKGNGKGSPAAWRDCLKAYGLTEAEALKYAKNPIDNLQPLATAKVPLLHVVGEADVVVPVEENTAMIQQRYLKLGGAIRVIGKKGVGHHPHSLKDPSTIVQFVLRHTIATESNVHLRGSFQNARIQFERQKKGHIAFIGGSITEMNGYRPLVCDILKRRFPDTKFTFTDAGISSTCSTTGAFRLQRDVLSKGPVDLFFIEFAVNDDQDAHHSRRDCIRGLEGILQQTRKHNPQADIVVTYFVNPSMLETIQQGNTPLTIAGHNEVVRHYQVSTIDLAREVARRIDAGNLTWKKYGGTHPAPFGNAIGASMIDELFSQAWSKPLPAEAKKVAHAAPRKPLDPLHYGDGRFVDLKTAVIDASWNLHVPLWKKNSRPVAFPLHKPTHALRRASRGSLTIEVLRHGGRYLYRCRSRCRHGRSPYRRRSNTIG